MSKGIPKILLKAPFATNVRDVLGEINHRDRHPGLELDKYHLPVYDSEGKSKNQKKILNYITQAVGDDFLLNELHERRTWQLSAQQAVEWRMPTAGPLTVHLARANTMENAGICLHPLYGFAYLPGSGLKGMARAFAETIWLNEQMDQKAAFQKIEAVFGWADNLLRKEQIKDPNHPAEKIYDDEDTEITACSGMVVFQDAWPLKWPELVVDVVTNHHKGYYQNSDLNTPFNAPGDWHDPNPVYFLAVAQGTRFSFAVTKRHPRVPDENLDLAYTWLRGALLHLGAGAKTAAGYGMFLSEDNETVLLKSPTREELTAELRLETPGFFAGGNQEEDDCDLRSASLRGLLRWWWRTMHAGYLDLKTLSDLEALLWGDTEQTGAICMTLVSEPDNPRPEKYDKNRILSRERLDTSYRNRKTTQGLFYASFGMDDTSRGKRRQRYYLPPGARWTLRFLGKQTKRKVKDRDKTVTAHQAIKQAQAALWMLCNYGAVGSKSRHGFGSLFFIVQTGSINEMLNQTVVEDEDGLDFVMESAGDFRSNLDLNTSFNNSLLYTPTLEPGYNDILADFFPGSVWQVMDRIGRYQQDFAKQYKHKEEKAVLGLPRTINSFHGQRLSVNVPGGKANRYAGPIHKHVHRDDGEYFVRYLAFRAPYLVSSDNEWKILKDYLDYVEDQQER